MRLVGEIGGAGDVKTLCDILKGFAFEDITLSSGPAGQFHASRPLWALVEVSTDDEWMDFHTFWEVLQVNEVMDGFLWEIRDTD